MIRLFSSSFDKNTSYLYSQGQGILSDALSCLVTEERNGKYEVEMEYPINGYASSKIQIQKILLVKPNPYDAPQPFRIYSIKQQINGVLTVCAAHISYDLSSQIVNRFPVAATTAEDAMAKLNTNSGSLLTNPFTYYTDVTTGGTMTVETPATTRSLLADGESSLVGIYGGELLFDFWNVELLQSRGSDRGVVIQYGKNMTDFNYEIDDTEMYVWVYPYWYSEEDGLCVIDSDSLAASLVSTETSTLWDSQKILVLDLSSEFSEKPSASELRSKAKNYIAVNDLVGEPRVSLSVSFVPLTGKSEVIKLCDTVTVKNDMLGITVKTKCIKTVYNAITDRYESIELDNTPSLLTDTISKLL